MNHDRDNAPAPIFTTEWLTRLRCLSLQAQRAGAASLFTPRPRKLPAGGTEATGVRDYSPGDDLRYVDWHLCARRDEVLTRTFEGTAERHLAVLLDVSRSMEVRPAGVGAAEGGDETVPPRSKFRLARQIVAAAGCWALENAAVFSLATFSGGLGPSLPALRGGRQTMRLLRFLEGLQLQDSPTDLCGAAATLARRFPRRGPVVVVSDLLGGEGFTRGLDLLRHQGYGPRVVHLFAPEDAKPPRLGDVELVDCETGIRQRATITERAAARYGQLFGRFLEEVAAYCRQHTLPWLQLSTDTTEEQVMRAVLGLPNTTRRSTCVA
ncbi:MAG: DUF58 domain-containing protein [Thermoguttaceae bacterium]|jgi:uncharacterized protein (DUF58 family)|nr:DUF58 domain-containing protein [Thermoguttaceae bacterium]